MHWPVVANGAMKPYFIQGYFKKSLGAKNLNQLTGFG